MLAISRSRGDFKVKKACTQFTHYWSKRETYTVRFQDMQDAFQIFLHKARFKVSIFCCLIFWLLYGKNKCHFQYFYHISFFVSFWRRFVKYRVNCETYHFVSDKIGLKTLLWLSPIRKEDFKIHKLCMSLNSINIKCIIVKKLVIILYSAKVATVYIGFFFCRLFKFRIHSLLRRSNKH